MSFYLSLASSILGWSYFLCWSVSFYPQFWTNYKLGHIDGYSKEFNLLNLYGFLAYFIYSIWGFIDPSIVPGVVDIQDIAFAGHAFALTFLMTLQCLWYEPNYLSSTHLWVKSLLLFLVLTSLIICPLQLIEIFPSSSLNFNGCLWLGYSKVLITLLKYFPQALKNFSRKSTEGWSIANVLLDFTGGLLSLIQIFVDGANSGNWNVFGKGGTFNIAKFCLGFTSMVFDLVFMMQHYFLYTENPIQEKLLIKVRGLSRDSDGISQV